MKNWVPKRKSANFVRQRIITCFVHEPDVQTTAQSNSIVAIYQGRPTFGMQLKVKSGAGCN